MNEKMSRVLLAIEALVLCLPLTLIYGFRVLPAALYFSGDATVEPLYLTVVVHLVIIAGLLSAWRLMTGFILFGQVSLRRAAGLWWAVSGLVACLALLAWLIPPGDGTSVPTSLSAFGWGVIFLPPYLHLLLERRRGTRTRGRQRSFFVKKDL